MRSAYGCCLAAGVDADSSRVRGWQGKVVSRKAQKTAIVEVTRMYTHPRYLKRVRSSLFAPYLLGAVCFGWLIPHLVQVRSTKRYPVHDENEVSNEGDVVTIEVRRDSCALELPKIQQCIFKY